MNPRVILLHPPGSHGAVPIYEHDVVRLNPGECLNDNLIEFGLKLWFKDLQAQDPHLLVRLSITERSCGRSRQRECVITILRRVAFDMEPELKA
ncbi:hypothetical protein C8J56DRAFT_1050114 [Mycena floridula]|nr:hypothetical protein C8J56DRAFT_1050114 [Mycena floridula]